MYIGIDLGGINIAVGIIDENGVLKHQKSCPTICSRSSNEVINDMKNLVLAVISESSINKNNIKSIGIGVPGSYDSNGNVVTCVNLSWIDIPLKNIFEEYFNVPIYIDNDAIVATLAEYKYGSMKNANSGVMITLGTGVGGGIILNGDVYRGYNSLGCELGHMIVGENFYNCNCGKNGCLETFASSTAIINYTKKLMKDLNEKTIITEIIRGNIDNLNSKIIFDCAKKGDKIASLAVNRFVKYLSIGINNIINIIDPEIIVIGGGVSNAGHYLLDLVKKELQINISHMNSSNTKIALAKLGNTAGIIGAALMGK